MTPDDPLCPECGEPVRATASFCVHCEADLDGTGAVTAAVVDLGEDTDAEEEEADGPGDLADGAEESDGESAPAATAESTGESAGEHDRGWLHPDGLLDDVSTGVAGVVGGFVVGFLATVLVLLTTGSGWALLVGAVAWVGAGLYVGWTRTVFGAVRKACYLTAPTLVAVPLFWFGEAPQGGDFAGRVVAFVVTEVVVVPVALLVAGVGYWIGGRAPTGDT